MAKNAKHTGTIITSNAIASYPHLAESRKNKRGQDRYDMCLVFADPKETKPMQTIALGLLKEQFGENAPSMVKSGKLHWPFRPADAEDVERKGYPKGSVYMNVSSTRPVGVVSRVKDANGKPTVIDPATVYAGSIVRASLDCFTFNHEEKKGVTFGLRNVQFIEDGTRMDGVNTTPASDEFDADLEQEDADLGDLEDGGEAETDATEDMDPLADLLS